MRNVKGTLSMKYLTHIEGKIKSALIEKDILLAGTILFRLSVQCS